MEFHLFPNGFTVFFSLVTGFFFGFFLRRGGVSRFDTIIGQLLLRDFTVMKIILTAIIVGSIGIYSLAFIGLIPTFHLSETPILFSALGGAVFGVGMSIAGYCPGTAIASIGEGSKDMIFGLLGMIFGSFVFNAISPSFLPYINQKDALFQHTIGSFFAIPNWVAIASIAALWVVFVLIVQTFERKGKIGRVEVILH
ncbi:MAG: YeeE/YedE family protein [Chlamydiia bacterium]|nr:YeeE/YedE family protein [Chlamydiia bacterium]